MKNIFRVIGFGVAVMAFTAISGNAQTDPCEDSYEVKTAALQKYRDNIKEPRTAAKLKIALEAGKEFIAKYGKCEDTEPAAKSIGNRMPGIQAEYEKLDRYNRFDTALNNKNWAELFKVGREIMNAEPDSPLALDIALGLASAGFDRAAVDKVDTFNRDTIEMANLAISMLEAGRTSENFGIGGLAIFKTKEFPNSTENALGWMNYIIGFVKYVRQKDTKAAVPFLYKAATKYKSATQGIPVIYQMIGAWYYEELVKLDKQRNDKIAANGGKDNDETIALWELERGYLERTIDAFARAYKILAANAKTTAENEAKNRLYADLQGYYKDSFKKTDGFDAYINTLLSKPMPDPMSAVQPIKEEVPATTTTTGATTSTISTPTTTTTPVTTATPASTPTTNAKPNNGANKKPAAKPAPKKKSGR